MIWHSPYFAIASDRPERAKQASIVWPFQGDRTLLIASPGAMPRAGLFGPFGAEDRNSSEFHYESRCRNSGESHNCLSCAILFAKFLSIGATHVAIVFVILVVVLLILHVALR